MILWKSISILKKKGKLSSCQGFGEEGRLLIGKAHGIFGGDETILQDGVIVAG